MSLLFSTGLMKWRLRIAMIAGAIQQQKTKTNADCDADVDACTKCTNPGR